jgi:hypothetical protein
MNKLESYVRKRRLKKIIQDYNKKNKIFLYNNIKMVGIRFEVCRS